MECVVKKWIFSILTTLNLVKLPSDIKITHFALTYMRIVRKVCKHWNIRLQIWGTIKQIGNDCTSSNYSSL